MARCAGVVAVASNAVEVLPADPAQRAAAIEAVQVTTRSPMGAVVYESGGLLEQFRSQMEIRQQVQGSATS